MTDTHVVIHKGFYRRFGGKITRLPVGTKLALDKQQGERMTKRGFVKPIDVPMAKPSRPVKAEKKADDEEKAGEPSEEKPIKAAKKRRSKK